MQLSIITPEKFLLSADVEMVTIPGSEGEFGVLPGHAPFISTLRPGIITIDMEGGEKRKVAVIAGIAEAMPDHCTVLAETARDISSFSDSEKETVRKELLAAREKLEAAKHDDDEAAQKVAGFTILLNELILSEFDITP